MRENRGEIRENRGEIRNNVKVKVERNRGG